MQNNTNAFTHCDTHTNWMHLLLLDFRQKKGSRYLINKGRVPQLILVLGSQPAGDMSHKPGSRLPLLSAMQYNTIQKCYVAVASEALANRTVKKHRRRRTHCVNW